MTSEKEARARELLVKLREEMRWLDVLRMLAAGGHPMLAREGFEETIRAVASGEDGEDEDGGEGHDDGGDGDGHDDGGDASTEDDVVDAEAVVRDKLASFTLPAWLRADLELVEAWYLERAASNEPFDDEPPQRSLDPADDFEREALTALTQIVDLMRELEPLCTTVVEPTGAFDFWQLYNWTGVILRGEFATSEEVGWAIGTPEEIANIDRLARRRAAEWRDQHERLAEEILAEGPLTDEELCAEVNRRWADPAVRERLSRAAQPWRPRSGVLMPPPDDL